MIFLFCDLVTLKPGVLSFFVSSFNSLLDSYLGSPGSYIGIADTTMNKINHTVGTQTCVWTTTKAILLLSCVFGHNNCHFPFSNSMFNTPCIFLRSSEAVSKTLIYTIKGVTVLGDSKKHSSLIKRKMHNKRGIFKLQIVLNYK